MASTRAASIGGRGVFRKKDVGCPRTVVPSRTARCASRDPPLIRFARALAQRHPDLHRRRTEFDQQTAAIATIADVHRLLAFSRQLAHPPQIPKHPLLDRSHQIRHIRIRHFAVLAGLRPAPAQIGAMQVWIHDAQGVEAVRDMIQVYGKQDFVWPIGLLPGTYTVKVSVFGDGSANATLQVAATPLRVDLPLAK